MFNHKAFRRSSSRATIMAVVAAVSVSAIAPTAVMAGTPDRVGKMSVKQAGSSGATDVSAARRRRGGGGGGNAAALAAFGAIAGTVGAIAASQNRGYYDDGPRYGYYNRSPGYYGGGPSYYGGGNYTGGYGGYGYGYGDNSFRLGQ